MGLENEADDLQEMDEGNGEDNYTDSTMEEEMQLVKASTSK